MQIHGRRPANIYEGGGQRWKKALRAAKGSSSEEKLRWINQRCGKDEVEEVEKELAEKFGRKVILLDTRFGEILTLPPEKHPGGAPRRP